VRHHYLSLLVMAMVTLSCSLFPAPTATPTVTPSGPCAATAPSGVTVYERPSFEADVFGTLSAGETTELHGETDGGWFGFDPGIAQAANIGPFRLRWIHQDEVTLSGDCSSLPEFWGPPPGICFDMPMEDVDVHASPDASSAVLVVLHVEEFAAVVGLSGTGWARVDLAPGNTGSSVVGWVEENTLNMNGPCDSLPTVTS